MMAQPTDWTRLNRRYGNAGSDASWAKVRELYEDDKVVEAWQAAQSLGTGSRGWGLVTLRMVEAEAVSRLASEQVSFGSTLTVEFPRVDDPELAPGIGGMIREVWQEVCLELGLTPELPVVVTVLLPNFDAQWVPGRHGYCIGKNGLTKVCIPWRSLRRSDDLRAVLLHELAHAATRELSHDLMPTWLNEAIATEMEGSLSRQYLMQVRTGRVSWMSPGELEGAFEVDRRDVHADQWVHLAYQQSAAIGRWISGSSSLGRRKLGDVAKAFANNSTWTELKLRVTGQTHADEALREILGFGEKELFDRVRHSIETRTLPMPIPASITES
ncbi:MAG: hypothetical protein LCH41_07345 [Armatimonadetes bacterium]|nr:hypothetical protein [Armatimonadota bacterium]